MSHSPKAPRRLRQAGLFLAFLCLPACGSAGHSMVVSVNPPEASLYINGERVSQGGRRAHVLTFEKGQRMYVQAIEPGYWPHFEWLTEEQVVDMLNRNMELSITLRQRR